MKTIGLFIFFSLMISNFLHAQDARADHKQNHEIYSLIDAYSLAREKQDTLLLKSILTADVDQLVSSGEWRSGIKASLRGMMQSSASNPGTRRLTIKKIRFLNAQCAIVDAKYDIQNSDGSERKMWSTFIVVYQNKVWKISAIRNMLPTESR
jgi:hypothetical protein